jgi:hypothetical protein
MLTTHRRSRFSLVTSRFVFTFGPLWGSLRYFCTLCVPHSGPRRAKRAEETLATSQGLRGDFKGRSALAGSLVLVAIGLGCGGGSEPAAAPPAINSEPTPATDQSRAPAPIIEAVDAPDAPTRILDPRADEILRAMATLHSTTKSFAFEAEERFDEIPSGQPRTLLTNVRRVVIQRPNRLAADAEGDTLSRSVWFDGQTFSVYDRAQNVYAGIPTPGSIDTALDTLTDKYAMAVPLADLLYADPYAILTEDVTYSKYLGLHRAAGVLSHHLVFAQPTIEWQIWIDAGEQPLVRQLAISYVREPGEPQYVAVLTKWKLSPSVPESIFRFEPPEGAVRVDAESFVPRLPGE